MIFIGHFLGLTLMTALFFYFVSQVLSGKLNIKTIAVLSIIIGLTNPLKVIFETNSTLFTIISFAAFSMKIVFVLWLCSGERWKKIVVPLFFYFVLTIADAITGTIIALVYVDMYIIFNESVPMAVYFCIGIILFGLLGLFGVYLWKMVNAKKLYIRHLTLLILPACFGFIFLISYLDVYTREWWMVITTIILGNGALLYYILFMERKLTMEDVRRETRHMMELEQSQYREVEKRQEEFTKIRHDFNNQLAVIGRLMRNGEESTARDMIDTLSHEIIQTRENQYCNIPVINAIITEKALICAQSGINLCVDLDIPDRLSVEKIHLCSIFGNLLDNAINACKQTDSEVQPTISLHSMVDGDYLFIKSTNPSSKPPKKRMPGRGYGSRILTDLAARYKGEYRGEYNDGVFTAVVLLLALDGD